MTSEIYSETELDEMAQRAGFKDWKEYVTLDTRLVSEPSARALLRSHELLKTVPNLTLNDNQRKRFERLKSVSGRRGDHGALESGYPGITEFAITYRLWVDEVGEPEYTALDIIELIDEEFGYRPSIKWVYEKTAPFLNRRE